jgi:NAD+ synthase (glutamine-hydrolysing)
MIATGGKLIASGPRLHYKPYQLTVGEIDMTTIIAAQVGSASRSISVEDSPMVVKGEFPLPVNPWLPGNEIEAPWEQVASGIRKYEEFTRAISLALYDYKRKSGSSGFVISLSGGTDSAAVLILTHYMHRLGGGPGKNPTTTIYQGTKNSSEVTKKAAETIAAACGSRHYGVDIEPIVEAYTRLASEIADRSLSWETDDIALQNIQPRVRGPLPWFIANIENRILLTTSNRSEAAVGYCTMDGDTCGGISVISGVGKTFLREWMAWVEKVGPIGLGNIPEASVINTQAPTAELRPLEDGKVTQSDEEDIMPYPVLDSIEHEAIGEKRSPFQILERLGFGKIEWVRKFFTLWSRNQWKRERLAPGFHVDDMNLDPRTWCRFPILNGGFRRELKDLETKAKLEKGRAN